MAFRTWGRLLLTALGVSVLAGAGQLGIAYGFGAVRLDGAFVDDSVNRWPAQLAWVGWFAAVATVAGAVLTEHLARRDSAPAGTTELLSIAGVSGLGAIVVAPLCMQPARAAELGGTVDPVWAVGICAILGAVVGAGAAIAVLLKPPFGWSIALTAAAVWLLALVSVAPSVASTGTLPTVRLGVLEPSWLDPAAAERLAMLLLPTLALLAGAAVGALARRAGYLPLVGGAAGAAGPVLLAFAYLTAGPGTAADRYQLAPYYGALIAVAAGALGSTATTVLPRPVTTAAGPDAIEPTDILQALPPSPAIPDPTDTAPAAPAALRPAGAPDPAHWDWPAAGGLTPAPVPAGLTRRPQDRPAPERPADRHEPNPVHGSGFAPARDEGSDVPPPDRPSDDTGPGQLPGSPPPGRRTSAIDVLAAGRPTPPAEPVTRPAPTAETAVPAAAHSAAPSATGRPEAPSVVAEPVTPAGPATEPRPTGRAEASSVAPRAALDRTEAAAAPEVAEAVPAEPATEAAATRATRSRRNRAAASTPEPRSADDAPSPARPVDAAASADDATLAGAPGTEAAAGAGDSTPAVPAGRAKRTRKPRTTRTTPASEPAPTTTPDGAAEPTASTPHTTAEAVSTTPDGTSGRDDTTAEPAGSRPDRPTEPAGSSPATAATTAPAPTGAEPAGSSPATAATTAPAPTGAEPAGSSPATAATTSPGAQPAGTARGADVPETSAPAEADPNGGGTPTAGERRSFFFDPEPAPTDLPEPPASPRPRIPIFEDVTPGNVRPAWPVAPAANWPVMPRGGPEPAAPGGPAGGRDTGTEGTTAGPARPEPTPRPRHRALPDLGRSTGWEALANARPTGPTAPPPTGRTPDTTAPTGPAPADSDATGQAPETTGRLPGTPGAGTTGRLPETTGPEAAGAIDRAPAVTGPILPAWDAPAPEAAGSASGGRHADGSAAGQDEAAGGKSKVRRSLFRRNRGKGGEADREAEPLAAQDEEYVDWVAGLGSDDNADDARSLRTGRHHRE
jgi:hypothetical protein